MIQILVIVMFISLWLFAPENAFAQNSNARQKTQELVASLSKSKYKKKERGNFAFEKYIDIKSEAVVKNNVKEYAGNYEAEDSNFRVELLIANDGKIEGNGYETYFQIGNRENFTLKNAKIEGALLTAEKVYSNGRTEKLEAVFINRTVIEGKNPNQIESRKTSYGLGFVAGNGNSTQRVFCEFKP